MTEPFVFLVDDDASIRDALSTLLGLNGIRVRTFDSGDALLAAMDVAWSGCVLLDLKMPGRDGLQTQQELLRRSASLPIVMMTAHGDVATVRAALKAGAHDFLEKPIDDALLVEVVRNVLDLEATRRHESAERSQTAEKLARLTRREREVMDLLSEGRQLREIAETLGISPRTVEVYKARMMEKLGTRSLADVIHLALRGQDLRD